MSDMYDSGVVVGAFSSRSDAERAVEELHRMGYDENQIGFATRDDSESPEGTSAPGEESKAAEGAGAGIAGGGLLGGVLGAAAAGLIPGIGPVIAVGALAGVLGGAAAGGAAGGIAGALAGMGVSDDDAQAYEEEFRAGRTIVTVQPGERTQSEVRAVLERNGAQDARTRRS